MRSRIKRLLDFVLNRRVEGAAVTDPALSITKVGVGAMFLWTFFCGLAAVLGPLNHGNAEVITGAFQLARAALVISGLVTAVDIVARTWIAVSARRADRGSDRHVSSDGGAASEGGVPARIFSRSWLDRGR